MVSQNISRSTDTKALIVCIVIATVFVIMRTCARWYKIRKVPFEMEDIFMYCALGAFAITTALYLSTIPTYFRVIAVELGLEKPWLTMEQDLVKMLKEFFVVQFFFWLTLWAVKWSLLFMFRRLTDGLPMYNKIWWAIFVYSVLTFIGSCISNFTSCSSMHAWFHAGECTSARDSRAKNISLWFSLAGDLSTDLLIMIVPMRLIFNLKISLVEKISIGFVFAVGIITMVTAIIRSVSLESSSTSGQVSTTWLMLWAGVEGAVAIIVGCLPSFAIFIRGRVAASRARYGSSNISASGPKRDRSHPWSNVGSPEPQQPWYTTDTASDKSLVDGGIVITRTWSQNWHNSSGQKIRKSKLESDLEMDTMRR